MSAADVQKLRQETGAGIMDCKKALDEARGDFAGALAVLKERGLAKAAKKGDRDIGASYLEAYIHGGRVGVLVEIGAETDFVTRSDDFREAAKNIAMQIAASAPESVEELMSHDYIREAGMSVEDYLKGVIAKMGENMKIARFTRYEV